MPHTTAVRVRFYELDPYAHVNHAVYFQYFETARIEALAGIGYDLARLKSEGFHLVVTGISARFHYSAEYGDELKITTELVETKRVSSTYRQVATKGDVTVATIEVSAAVTDLDGKPRRAPADFLDALETLR